MKKIIVAICLAFLSVGAYANSDAKIEVSKKSVATEVKTDKKFDADYTFTSSCGDVWDVHTSEGLSMACHMALWAQMEAACGTSTTYVEVEEGNDC